MARRKLLVEGWRFIPHSYAMVNHWQLLALRADRTLELRVRDLPLHGASWRAERGLMQPDQEAALHALQPPEPGFVPDVTLRIGFPYDLSPAPAGRTVVFCTSEFGRVDATGWASPPDAAALARRTDLTVITPSAWSARGLANSGIPSGMIRIVPHGVDTGVFAPDPDSGKAMRQRLGIGPGKGPGNGNAIVFMNASAMTANKGIDLLLRGFAQLCRQRHDVYLLLKGTDALYRSNARVGATLHGLGPDIHDVVAPRLVYGGTTLSTEDMAGLYRAADVYVSPYRAEGFNLPVLEAMASGVPVICTAGGPTDEFVANDCGLKFASQTVDVAMPDGGVSVQLQPSVDELARLMLRAADDAAWRAAAGRAARERAAGLTWDKAVEQLRAALF